MLARWSRHLLWRPFEVFCRRNPLIPLRATLAEPVEGVTSIRIENLITRALGRFGGYDYSVCYLIDGALLVDTGFPWARRCLARVLAERGAEATLRWAVNTHDHEDHTGNNDLIAERTSAEILAHPLAIPEIRFPRELPWYRRFLFGPMPCAEVRPIPDRLDAGRYIFEVHHLPGHCPGHIGLFEPRHRWLFSGDLYIAPDLDSQLADADGPQWIASLERAIALQPRCLFDGHGVVLTDEPEVNALLVRKRDFLVALRERILAAAVRARSVREITAEVFRRRNVSDRLSFNDGWLSLITGSDFSRSNLVRSFLRSEGQMLRERPVTSDS